jgi:hypothetical protein
MVVIGLLALAPTAAVLIFVFVPLWGRCAAWRRPVG